jgi:hypothetical protein
MSVASYREETRYKSSCLYGLYPVIARSASDGYVMERSYCFPRVSTLQLISRFRCIVSRSLRQKSGEVNFGSRRSRNQALNP